MAEVPKHPKFIPTFPQLTPEELMQQEQARQQMQLLMLGQQQGGMPAPPQATGLQGLLLGPGQPGPEQQFQGLGPPPMQGLAGMPPEAWQQQMPQQQLQQFPPMQGQEQGGFGQLGMDTQGLPGQQQPLEGPDAVQAVSQQLGVPAMPPGGMGPPMMGPQQPDPWQLSIQAAQQMPEQPMQPMPQEPQFGQPMGPAMPQGMDQQGLAQLAGQGGPQMNGPYSAGPARRFLDQLQMQDPQQMALAGSAFINSMQQGSVAPALQWATAQQKMRQQSQLQDEQRQFRMQQQQGRLDQQDESRQLREQTALDRQYQALTAQAQKAGYAFEDTPPADPGEFRQWLAKERQAVSTAQRDKARQTTLYKRLSDMIESGNAGMAIPDSLSSPEDAEMITQAREFAKESRDAERQMETVKAELTTARAEALKRVPGDRIAKLTADAAMKSYVNAMKEATQARRDAAKMMGQWGDIEGAKIRLGDAELRAKLAEIAALEEINRISGVATGPGKVTTGPASSGGKATPMNEPMPDYMDY